VRERVFSFLLFPSSFTLSIVELKFANDTECADAAETQIGFTTA